MSLFKLAFVRGLQNALVNSGAIPPYRSEIKADLAVKVASYALPRNWKLASEEDVADAMSAMASGAEDELSPEEQEAVMSDDSDEEIDPEEAAEALENQADVAEELADASGDAADALENMHTEDEAREVVAMLKRAAENDVFGGGVANPAPALVDDYETEAGDRANAMYANAGGDRAMISDPSANADPFTGAMKDLSEGVSLDAKTASLLLRKLAEDAAYNVGPDVADPDNIEEDPRPEGYANFDQGDGAFQDTAPFTGDMQKASAYNYLLKKTASEVGRYLPKRLKSRDKLAAIRAMIGMSNKERAGYIQRIKWAMEDDQDTSRDEGRDSEEMDEDSEDEGSEESSESSSTQEEKKASYILRKLGLGGKSRVQSRSRRSW
jgi:hypothetical protein